MPAAFYIFFGGAFTLASALSAGALVFRFLNLRFAWPLVFVVGACPLSLAVTLLAFAGLAHKGVFLAVGTLLIAGAAISGAYRVLERIQIKEKWFWIGFAPFTILYFFNAMAPEASPDGTTYHLAFVNRYYHEHRMVPIPEDFYASLSQGVEMLFLYAFAFGRHSSAALVHFLYLLVAPLMIADFATRKGWPLAGAFAGLLFYATPIVGKDGTCAYNDVALASIWFALFVMLDEFEPRRAIPAGMLAGFCYAVKYTAFIAIFFVLWRFRKHWRSAVVACGVAAIFVLPWVLRNWLWIGNPFAPFFNAWFPNPWLSPFFERDYTAGLRDFGVTGFGDWARSVFFKGEKINGLLGPVWLLAPLGFLEWPWMLAGAAAAINRDIRFLIPTLPFLALGIGKVLARWPRAAIDIAILHLILSSPWVLSFYAPNGWRLTEIPWKAALRIEPETDTLRFHADYIIARMVESFVPPDETVLSMGAFAGAYTNRRVLISHNSAPGQDLRDMIFAPIYEGYRPAWQRQVHLARPSKKIRLLQVGKSVSERWSISEIDPTPARVRASTDDWNSRYAMDRNPYTRWLAGDRITPGQWFEMEYDREVETVSLWLTPSQYDLSFKVDGQDATIQASDKRADPRTMRRWVTETLRGQGIRYFVIDHDDFGYKDLIEHVAEWNMTEVATRGPKTLFKLN